MFSSIWVFLYVLSIVAGIEAGYTTVQSKYNESHAIRIKEHADGEVCNGGGKHYTGWADVDARHLFYWYHPVRHGNEEDAPLLIWLQGGPGASSMIGMFMLHGPCQVNEGGNSTTFNPHSWNEDYNVLFIDQPAGVGFSYVDNPKNYEAYPQRTEESTYEFLSTVNLIYEALPHLKNTSLFLAGESYGGRYVPLYGSAILDWNAKIESERKIPLVSIMLGDGWTSPQDQIPTYYDVGCFEVDGIPPAFNSSVCATLPPIVERCESLLDACIAFPDGIICKAANDYCFEEVLMRIELNDINVYDRTVKCIDEDEELIECYPQQQYIENLLNLKDVQKELEIEKQTNGKVTAFNITSDVIQERYMASGDFCTSSTSQLQKIINDPTVEVLIYVGKNDWIVTALGTGRMLERMRFQGYVEFRAQPKTALPWKSKAGGAAGTVRKIDGLWLVELNGAGHLVPHDQPSSALHMVQAWKSEVEGKAASVSSFKSKTVVKEESVLLAKGKEPLQRPLGRYGGLRSRKIHL